jgi:ribonuclease D
MRDSRYDSQKSQTTYMYHWQDFHTSKEGQKTWSYKLYRRPNREKVRVTYCRTLTECDDALSRFSNTEVLGLDIEPKMGGGLRPKDQVSVLQLASDGDIAIIHFAGFPREETHNLVSPDLKSILGNPDIIKAGHNIAGDGTRLKMHLGITSKGFVEVAGLMPADSNMTKPSLADLVEEFLGLAPDKNRATRTSNWHSYKPLSRS